MTVIVFRVETITPPINQTKASDWSRIPSEEIRKMVRLQSLWERGMKNSKTPLGKAKQEFKAITALGIGEDD